MARPKKPIDKDHLGKLAERGWFDEEIAAFFDVHVDTIKRRFADFIATQRLKGRAKLRDLQWQRAIAGSDRMIIHMSQHKLGEHAKVEQTVTANTTVNTSPALTELLVKLQEELK